MTTRIPPVDSIRIIPRDAEFLSRKLGSRGEVFFDQQSNTLRLYDGIVPGGIPLLKADFSNAEGVIGAALGDVPPNGANAKPGTIWFNTATGRLYILYSDGTSSQWVQPYTPSYGGGSGGGASAMADLTDVSLSSPVAGQVLKYNGTRWVNGTDSTGTPTTYTLPTATTSVLGGVKIDGTTINIDGNGVISASQATPYTLPVASQSQLGGVKIDGSTIIATNGVISANLTATFNTLTDVQALSKTIDEIAYPAITMLEVTNNGATSYRFANHYGTTDNPTVYAISGATIAFKLRATGHPFLIQDSFGNDYSNGLIHVSTTGVVSTGTAAQGKTSGTLYWQIPASISGTYRYQCLSHVGMVGGISVKLFSAL